MDDALVYGSGYETSEAPWNDRLSDIREAECPEERAGQQGWVREERVRTPVWRLAPPPEDSPEEVLESPESPKQKFMRLRDEWKIQRRHESSTVKMVMMPAYQKIIGMGPAAVPFLLRELETNLDSWFWALMAITDEDPVPEEARGDGEAMAQAWLKWAKERGREW